MKKLHIFFLLIFYTSLYSQTWTLQTSGTTNPFGGAFAVSGQVCWISGQSNNIRRTTNGGTTWIDAHGNLSAVDAYTICAVDANRAWIGAGDGTIYRTTNGGVNWIQTMPSPANPFIDGVYMYNANTGFAIGDPSISNQRWSYYITTNGGVNWNLGVNAPIISLSEAGWTNGFATTDTGHIWWGTNSSKIYRGSLWGSFNYYHDTAANVFGLAFQDANTGIAIGNNGSAPLATMKTTNGGINWFMTSFITSGIGYGTQTKPSTSAFYWIVTTTNIYRSTDNGNTFASQLSLPSAGFCISMVNVDTGWAGCANGNIYKYTANDLIGITENNKSIPKEYSLSQNYPNPFNPSTTIDFSLPRSSHVSLMIYDILGNEVMNVMDEFKPTGNYSVNVDGSKLSSGIYFYTLSSGDFKETKKMILLR